MQIPEVPNAYSELKAETVITSTTGPTSNEHGKPLILVVNLILDLLISTGKSLSLFSIGRCRDMGWCD
jgi:hypothetical protein